MDLAVGQEGHPDNLGASLRGGVTVTCWDAETRAVVSLPVPDGVEFAVLVPGLRGLDGGRPRGAAGELPAGRRRLQRRAGGPPGGEPGARRAGSWSGRRWAIGCTSPTAAGPCSPGSTACWPRPAARARSAPLSRGRGPRSWASRPRAGATPWRGHERGAGRSRPRRAGARAARRHPGSAGRATGLIASARRARGRPSFWS